MCTFTYFPLKNNFILTSNRDEHINRGVSKFPVVKQFGFETITFPQDPEAGGTWLATSDKKRTIVLLNGAFEKHKHLPPYRVSRGIVLLDAFKFKSLTEFSEIYSLVNVEPFTIIQVNGEQKTIEELRWDGDKTFIKPYCFKKPHIWSSATLYTPKVISQRQNWFNEWIKQSHITPEKMLEFHQFGGGKNGGTNTITMARGNVLRTVSISQIHHSPSKTTFSHLNLLSKEDSVVII